MKRVFFAIPVNADEYSLLERAVRPIAEHWGDQLRWIPKTNWHITIRFLGNVTDEAIDYLVNVAKKFSCEMNTFLIKISEIQGFPSLDSQRIAAHIQSCKELERLFQALGVAALNLGLPSESRSYRPHISLAKFASQIHPDFDPLLPDKLTLYARELVLFHSKPAGEGSEYISLKTFRFNEQ